MKRTLWAGAGLAGLSLLGGFAYQHYLRPAPPPPPDALTLERLRNERAALQHRLRELLEADPGLARAPAGSVLIGVPTSFVRSLVEQTLTGLLGQVHVRLRNLKVHKADEVKARTPVGRMTLGDYRLDVTIRELQGLLEPGAPELRFGGDRLGVKLPVKVSAGQWRANLRFRWDGRKLAGAVCGDLDLKREVEGTLQPLQFTLAGELLLAARGEAIVATPRFGDVKLALRVVPSQATWQMLDGLIAEQSAVCRSALEKVDVAAKVKQLVARGFPVTLARTLWRPLRLPAALRQELDVPGPRGRAGLLVAPIGLTVVPERFWYAADVKVQPPP